MQHASQRSPGWADLQPELVLRVAALLGNEDRWRVVATCRCWYAAIEAGPPDLWPAAVLACPPLQVTQLTQANAWSGNVSQYAIQQACAADTANTLRLVSEAASLPSPTWRVRIEGEAQPLTAAMSVMVLPPGVRWLELAITPCAGPLLLGLARFTRLQSLAITGNGADIDWAVGPPAALRPLQHLCLDYRRPPVEDVDGTLEPSVVDALPSSAQLALVAATALHTLELRLVWSDKLAAVCRALPALRHLRLHLYYCGTEDGVTAVQLFGELPQLSSIALGIHGCDGSELDCGHPQQHDWADCVRLPPLSSLTALTELYLVGAVDLPPDFGQLVHLQRLTVVEATTEEGEGFESGSAPLSGLAALTRLEVIQGYEGMRLPDPATLALVPNLAEVHAPDSAEVAHANVNVRVAAWRTQLATLRPDVRITT